MPVNIIFFSMFRPCLNIANEFDIAHYKLSTGAQPIAHDHRFPICKALDAIVFPFALDTPTAREALVTATLKPQGREVGIFRQGFFDVRY